MLQVEEVYGNLPEVETDRLRLIRASPDRAPELFAFSGDPEATRYMSFETNPTVERTEHAIRCMMGMYEKGEVAPWLILHRGVGRVIGMTGYNWWHPRHARAEISYALAPQYWGQGLASEAVRAVIRFGFERMALNRIEALVHPGNRASCRVLERAGFTAEGLLREVLFIKGAPADHLIYTLLRRDWPAGGTSAAICSNIGRQSDARDDD